MIRMLIVVAAFVATSLSSSIALAHAQKAALTEVLFNARSGNIEVAHRFTLHDAEQAVRDELSIDGDLETSPAARARFATYVAERFSLATQNGVALPLTVLGTQLDGGYLWVYQEVPYQAEGAIADTWQVLRVRNYVLRDIWPDQTNTVNVKRGKMIRTVVFSDFSDERIVDFRE